jgi:deoxycytidine triphosphate deaminase
MPIRGFDETQLSAGEPGESNLSYDLRVGAEYRDHRYGWKRDIFENDHITLLPGSAVIIETEESLLLPAKMLGYIVPGVYWLQQGVSNTLSKVDSGYNGHLLVTLFNLGKNTICIDRRERFCSLVLHSAGADPRLYDKGEKRIAGPAQTENLWQKARNIIEAHPATATLVLALVTLVLVVVTAGLAIVEFTHLHRAVSQPVVSRPAGH